MNEQQPGSVISPNGDNANQEVSVQFDRAPAEPTSVADTPASAPQPEEQLPPQPAAVSAEPVPESPVAPAPTQPIATDASPALRPAAQASSTAPTTPAVSWTASEFIHHAKSLNWYLILAVTGVLGAIGVYFLTHEIISTAAIVIVAVLFGISASSKPRVLPYEIGTTGVLIGNRQYPYSNFKTFSVLHDGSAFSSIQLMPLRRFAPPVSMYFPPEDEESIVTALSAYLPYEERKVDATDRLLRRIRF